ncbi:MAG TPA: chemotaxis protein CheW [Aliidongia sp.]|nr:chemotaxis protein CheW [Aliidongia sp.]
MHFSTVTDEAGGAETGGTGWLLCRAGALLCALPLPHVIETMRVLPAETVAGAPAYVRGLSMIRGAPTLVVDLAALVGGAASTPSRLVTVRTGARTVALAVDDVLGIRAFEPRSEAALPPLLREAAGELVEAIGRLDAELVLLLRTSRIVPDAPLPAHEEEVA